MGERLNPINELVSMQNRLYSAKVAESAVKLCMVSWKDKVPLHKRNFWKIKRTFNRLVKKLGELDDAIEKFNIEFRPTSLDKLIKYRTSLVVLSEKNLQNIKAYEGGRIIRQRDIYDNFTDLFFLIDAINDKSMAINKTIDIIDGDMDMDLYGGAKEIVLQADKFISMGKSLPDKRANTVANTVWSYFELCAPTIKSNDKYVLDSLIIGHPDAWHEKYADRVAVIRYISKIYNNFGAATSPRIVKNGKPYQWYNLLCGPSMRHLLFASEALLAKLDSPNQERENITYIS